MRVLFNGVLVPIEQTAFNEKGWLDGNGIFETIKTVDSKPWALSRHMRRVVNSAKASGIKLPNEEITRASIAELLTDQILDSGYLRLFFDSNGSWGAVHLPYLPIESSAHLGTYPVAVDGEIIKRYPYHHRLEILDQIRKQGFDEAVIINSKEKICEAATANLLLKIGGRWCTPPISDGTLPGIVRALVIENFGVVVRSIHAEEVTDIESGFLLSSLRICRPVESVDGRQLSLSPDLRAQIEAMAIRTSVG